LHVVALYLDRRLQRLGAEKLLERRAAVLEGLLRVVGELGRDRLPALRHGAELLHRDIDVVFAKLLKVFEILEHESPLAARRASHQARFVWVAATGETVPSGSSAN